jgi:hypothetical protein
MHLTRRYQKEISRRKRGLPMRRGMKKASPQNVIQLIIAMVMRLSRLLGAGDALHVDALHCIFIIAQNKSFIIHWLTSATVYMHFTT